MMYSVVGVADITIQSTLRCLFSFAFSFPRRTGRYFILPSDLRESIWQGTILLRQPIRTHLFDYDNFVIQSKDAVTLWARDRLQADVGSSHRFPNLPDLTPNWFVATPFSLVSFMGK